MTQIFDNAEQNGNYAKNGSLGKNTADEKIIKRVLNFQIKNEGIELSFGQKQLFCLARALLKDSKIYLIDEATSNLDKE